MSSDQRLVRAASSQRGSFTHQAPTAWCRGVASILLALTLMGHSAQAADQVGPFRVGTKLYNPQAPTPAAQAKDGTVETATLVTGSTADGGAVRLTPWSGTSQAAGVRSFGGLALAAPAAQIWQFWLDQWDIQEWRYDPNLLRWVSATWPQQDVQWCLLSLDQDAAAVDLRAGGTPVLAGPMPVNALALVLPYRWLTKAGSAWQTTNRSGVPPHAAVIQVPKGKTIAQAQADAANQLGLLNAILNEVPPASGKPRFRLQVQPGGAWQVSVTVDNSEWHVDVTSAQSGNKPCALTGIDGRSGVVMTVIGAGGATTDRVVRSPVTIGYAAVPSEVIVSPRNRRPFRLIAPTTSSVSPAPIDGYLWRPEYTATFTSAAQPGVTTPVRKLGGVRFACDAPLLPSGESTAIVVRQSGTPVTERNAAIAWQPTDITADPSRVIRVGDSLLLTATSTASGPVTVEIDADGDGDIDYSGPSNTLFPFTYSTAGAFTARAWSKGVQIGAASIKVCAVILPRIVSEVGFEREVVVNIGTTSPASLVFEPADAADLAVRVLDASQGRVRLGVKALRRGTPVLLCRLKETLGLLAQREVEEFVFETKVNQLIACDGATGIAKADLTMRPFIPDVTLNYTMEANTATFRGGARTMSVNTSGGSSTLGDPPMQQVADPVTGELIGVFVCDLEIPVNVGACCYRVQATQSDPALATQAAAATVSLATGGVGAAPAMAAPAPTETAEQPVSSPLAINPRIKPDLYFGIGNELEMHRGKVQKYRTAFIENIGRVTADYTITCEEENNSKYFTKSNFYVYNKDRTGPETGAVRLAPGERRGMLLEVSADEDAPANRLGASEDSREFFTFTGTAPYMDAVVAKKRGETGVHQEIINWWFITGTDSGSSINCIVYLADGTNKDYSSVKHDIRGKLKITVSPPLYFTILGDPTYEMDIAIPKGETASFSYDMNIAPDYRDKRFTAQMKVEWSDKDVDTQQRTFSVHHRPGGQGTGQGQGTTPPGPSAGGNANPPPDWAQSQYGGGNGSVGRYRGIDLQGVPVSAPSPTGEGEGDRVQNDVFISMFDASLNYSATDVAVPVEGGELALEMRRTCGTSMKEITLDQEAPYGRIIYASDNILGGGWSTNIGSRIILQVNDTSVTVVDDVGGNLKYMRLGERWIPYSWGTMFSQDAIRHQLETTKKATNGFYPTEFTLTRAFGTKVVYAFLGTFFSPDGKLTQRYYRPIRVEDRNGNRLLYSYLSNDPKDARATLVSRIEVSGAAERKLTFGYERSGQIEFGEDLGWRLVAVTDPLGRTTRYQGYQNLDSVTRPDPDGDGPLKAPVISFGYDVRELTLGYVVVPFQGPNQIPKYRYTSLSNIRDARGAETRVAYADKEFSAPALVGGAFPKPYITSVTTPDGTISLTHQRADALSDGMIVTTSSVTDARGVRTDYRFESRVQLNIYPVSENLVRLTRTTVGRTDLKEVSRTATFEFANDVHGNLIRSIDMSGNVIEYQYVSNRTDDPYNAQPYQGLGAPNGYGNYYRLFNQPALRIVDPGMRSEGRLNLATAYSYTLPWHKLAWEKTYHLDGARETTDYPATMTRSLFDGKGNRIQMIRSMGGLDGVADSVTKYTYEADGFLKEETGPNGQTTRYARAINKTSMGRYRTVTTTRLDARYDPIDNANPSPSNRSIHGSLGVPSYSQVVTRTLQDIAGRTIEETDGRGATVVNTYDDLDRITAVTLPSVPFRDPKGAVGSRSAQRLMRYDENGNVVRADDENGNVTVTTYDPMNRPLTVRRRMTAPESDLPGDIVTKTFYNEFGAPRSEIDARGNETRKEYDHLCRLVRLTHPKNAGQTLPDVEEFFYGISTGENPGSGTWSIRSGWNPTRVINARGFATDVLYDASYRKIRAVRRADSGRRADGTVLYTPSQPARTASGESETLTYYNAGHQPILAAELELRGDQRRWRVTETFYDLQLRPTATKSYEIDGTLPPQRPGVFPVFNDGFKHVGPSVPGTITTRTRYDATGSVVLAADANDAWTRTVYDGLGRPWRVVADANGPGRAGRINAETVTTYDPNGNVIMARDAENRRAGSFYDARNRKVRTIADLNNNLSFETTRPDDDTLPESDQYKHDIVIDTEYDLVGNALRVTDARGFVTDTKYDRANRVVLVALPAVVDALETDPTTPLRRPTTRKEYDGNGNVTRITDPRDRTTETAYDARNRAITVTANIGTDPIVTRSAYDGNGNVTRLTLENGPGPTPPLQSTTYLFDAFDRKLEERLPAVADGAVRRTRWTYTIAGLVSEVADAKGQRIRQEYDFAKRMIRQDFFRANGSTEEVRTFAYSYAGKLQQSTDVSGTTVYELDALDRTRMERHTAPGGIERRVDSVYDRTGNRIQIDYVTSGRRLTTVYDPAGRMDRIIDTVGMTTGTTRYIHDRNGNRRALTLPSGQKSTYRYDAAGRNVEAVTVAANGAETSFNAWAFDLAGNRRSHSERIVGLPDRIQAWEYDAHDRLTRERDQVAGVLREESWTYDKAGNRLTRTVAGQATTTYAYDALNRLLSESTAGAVVRKYTYDLNGNQTEVEPSSKIKQRYTWDVQNRLVAADMNADGVADFTAVYDARTRRRVVVEAGATTVYGYDGGECFEERDGAGALRSEYVRGNGMGGGIGATLYVDRAGTSARREYFAYNPSVGHVVATVAADGTTASSNRYDAWGKMLASTGDASNKRLANTKERSIVLGLDNHGFRYYDYISGRYISRDPAGAGINFYIYVSDNPIRSIDPLGLEEEEGGFFSRIWGSVRAIGNAMGSGVGAVNYNHDLQMQYNPLLRAKAQGGWVEKATNASFGVAVGATTIASGGLLLEAGAVAAPAVLPTKAALSTALVLNAPAVQTGLTLTGAAATAYSGFDAARAAAQGDWQQVGMSATLFGAGAPLLGGAGNMLLGRAERMLAPNLEGFSISALDVRAGGFAALGKGYFSELAAQVRGAGKNPVAIDRRTFAVGVDESGVYYVASSGNRMDAGQRAMAEQLGLLRVGTSGAHAEENLLRAVQGLRRVGTWKRDPCGKLEHDCEGQLRAKKVEAE